MQQIWLIRTVNIQKLGTTFNKTITKYLNKRDYPGFYKDYIENLSSFLLVNNFWD